MLGFAQPLTHHDAAHRVDRERDEMPGLPLGGARESLPTPFEVIEKIALTDVINGAHAGAGCILATILQCVVDQLAIALACLVAE
jgi:hypothetical protein